ncbi:hypothetical protein B0T19DRAFT_117344 [Cercophora scortea]|uniref:DUF7729 domain-containing protein n=1 Tax=Cercophora scortea TaxID=314031 RepID=A0AAE0MHW7_9PEZI|nr:hypothetical protein B0T19DRAFT_117344 [Cercophora scortea]
MASAAPSPIQNGRFTSRISRTVRSPAHSHRRPRSRIQWAAVFLALVCLVCQATAITLDVPEPIETLELDTRVLQIVDGKWVLLSQEEVDLRKIKNRAVTTTFSIGVGTATHTADTTTTTSDASASTTTTADDSTSSTTTTLQPSPLPSPLDGGLSSNFTGAAGQNPCPNFINTFLADPTFKQCYPLSLLLQGSRSFFNAAKSIVSLTQVLDATCSANVTFCSTYLSSLAENITSPDNCGADYQLGNSIVTTTYVALVAYAPIYTATCLKDPQTSTYCFANAMTNISNPSSVYFYYLPLNLSLPGATVPTCSSCLQKTMNVFHDATADRSQPIALSYSSAAQQVNTICGPGFVNQTLAPEAQLSSRSPAAFLSGPSTLLMTSLMMLAMLPWLV